MLCSCRWTAYPGALCHVDDQSINCTFSPPQIYWAAVFLRYISFAVAQLVHTAVSRSIMSSWSRFIPTAASCGEFCCLIFLEVLLNCRISNYVTCFGHDSYIPQDPYQLPVASFIYTAVSCSMFWNGCWRFHSLSCSSPNIFGQDSLCYLSGVLRAIQKALI